MAKVIAEIGSNWRTGVGNPGSKDDCDSIIEHIKGAAECGADIVKFQLFSADTLYSKSRAPEQYNLVKNFEFPMSFLGSASEQCVLSGVDLWVSVFSYDLACQAVDYVDALKIASGDLTNYNLFIGTIGLANDYRLIFAFSTGAATKDEVDYATKICRTMSWRRPVVFQCNSAYPALATNANLNALLNLKDTVRALGYSDHTNGFSAAQVAVGCGYTFFEKHFRLKDSWDKSPDFSFSFPSHQFEAYVQRIVEAEFILGDDTKNPIDNELKERIWARRGKDGLRPATDS